MTNERIGEIKVRLAKLPKQPWSRETHDVVRGDNRYGSDPYNVLLDDDGKVITDSMNADLRCIEGNCDDGFIDSGTMDAFELFVHAAKDMRDLLDALEALSSSQGSASSYWKDERALIHAELDKAGAPNCDNIPLRIEALACRASSSSASSETPRWQPIETAPKMRKIIVTYLNALGKRRTVMGCYYLAHSLEMHDDYAEVGIYDEATGESFAPEGWYDEHDSDSPLMPLQEPPTHWMPLPAPPEAAPSSSPEERPAGETPARSHCRRCGDTRIVYNDAGKIACPDCCGETPEARADDWKPFDTAPRWGKILLLSSRGMQIGKWSDYTVYNAPRFTHWHPLPALPEAHPSPAPPDPITAAVHAELAPLAADLIDVGHKLAKGAAPDVCDDLCMIPQPEEPK